MSVLELPIKELSDYEEIKNHLMQGRGVIQLSGCIDAVKPYLIQGLTQGGTVKLLVTFSEQKAKELVEDYKVYDKNVVYYPPKDVLFYQADIRGNLLTRERLSILKQLRTQPDLMVITTFDGLMDRLVAPDILYSHVIKINSGDTLDMDEISIRLVEMGYVKRSQVETPGQFAIRGGIMDIYPLSEEVPVRIELWDDEIDSIRSFDAESQRSIEVLEHVEIYPATEIILSKETIKKGLEKIKKEADHIRKGFYDKGMPEEAYRLKQSVEELEEDLVHGLEFTSAESFLTYFYNETATFLDYFQGLNTVVFLDEPARLGEKGRTVETEYRESMKQRLEKGYFMPGQADAIVSAREVMGALERRCCVALTTLDLSTEDIRIEKNIHIQTKSINAYNKSFDLLVKDLTLLKKKRYRVVLASGSRTRAQRIAEDLREEGLNAFYNEDWNHPFVEGEILVCYGKLRKGFEIPLVNFALISESDIFGEEKKKKRSGRIKEGDRIRDFAELRIGDYVVHENHGLGIYRGLEKVEVDKIVRDYIKIEYDKGGVLYIQASNLEMLQKYASAEAKKPKLNRLGGQEWTKTKTRVRGAVREIAKDLVQLYAIRESIQGFSYSKDSVWQQEFEEMFPFEETEDQVLAIDATKRDMESKRTMDRLICGDVGFGKTEIAIRAAFKAVQDSKQVVYLVPTTILAQQHYDTFAQRMKDFPIRVDLLCRFRSPAQQKKTLADLKNGNVDIVIGTHRLLSKDVAYKDLGLLIIDEEQRFGVTHKEQIKQLKNQVDVLTLTATPIPRTLHMSLIGIRDMSILEEPPVDRMPIQIYVMEYNEELIREAINRELARNGQVYYVFNRVKQIAEVADRIAALVPNATVAFAHGQMKEQELEKIMYRFVNGEIDVLVSTTIIETGLDISNVNTMIIQDADQLGLSQLYQLRGRVGRSNRTSYAFLMYRRDKLLKEVAEKRLNAIREFTELGSGIKIAMKDLEIRGAGNLLGSEQHGHMEAVGYELYCKMLAEAVKEMKGLPVLEGFETVIDVNVSAHIPATYVPNEFQKLDMYKRIGNILTEEDKEDILEEFIDRFGDPPASVENLLQIAMLKARAQKCFITEITEKHKIITLRMFEKANVKVENIPDLLKAFEGALTFQGNGKSPIFSYKMTFNSKTSGLNTIQSLDKILSIFEDLLVINEKIE